MIKGHVQVDLHNHKTGLRDRIEGDNMITNAMNYVIPNLIGAGISASEIMPLCQRVLGGIMLFDGKLTEDKNNIFFPSEAHLVASAGRNTNTEYADRGSLNVAETYETDTGFQSVWDFTTSQANGTIGSLALTMAENNYYYSDPYAIDWRRGTIHNVLDGNIDAFEMYPLCYDSERGYLYYQDYNNSKVTSRYDSSERVTYYTSIFGIMKQYIPARVYGIADAVNRRKTAEKVAEFSIEIKGRSVGYGYLCSGYDGYAYLISSIDEAAEYWRVKISDYSFEISDKININLKGCKLKQGEGKAVISKGYAFLSAEDLKSIYIVNLANPADVKQAILPSDAAINTDVIALNNGGIKFGVKLSDGRYCGAFGYPDGNFVLQGRKEKSAFKGYVSIPRLITDNLMAYGNEGYDGSEGNYKSYGRQVINYLGSIFNLPQPIVKTAVTSMKITYTLTNV